MAKNKLKLFRGRPSVTLYTRRIRQLISAGNLILVAAFAFVQLSKIPISIVANDTAPTILWHTGLALYYASWVFGTRFDVDVQELVYHEFPEQGRVPAHGYAVIAVLVIVAAILLWTEENVRRF